MKMTDTGSTGQYRVARIVERRCAKIQVADRPHEGLLAIGILTQLIHRNDSYQEKGLLL